MTVRFVHLHRRRRLIRRLRRPARQPTEPPDGILRSGSCVEIEPNNDVREIACTGDEDLVVKLFIPIGARCPTGLLGYRDRLGLGTVCLEA